MKSSSGMLEQRWPDRQTACAAGLAATGAYAHHPAAVEHVETHISHVFLTGGYAYKVKKPVDLGFLDFSTLEKRLAACEEEVRINRRLAPDLYLGVVPVSGSDQAPMMEGAGPVIDYAVKMRQFPRDAVLDCVFEHSGLTGAMVDGIARQVADFHLTLAASDGSATYGSSDSAIASARQNFVQLGPLLTGAQDVALLEDIRQWTEREGNRLGPVFDSRRRAGFVRECHGDLHLGNLALWRERVCIFDAIEFNADLRWIDVMSEVAFLTMDLCCRRRPDLGWRFLNAYLECTGDYAGLAVLRYYLVYRAMVRAKVHALRLAQDGEDTARRNAQTARIHAHLLWAHELIAKPRSALIVLHGFSGSGKTHYSQTVLETIGAVRIRSDVERKRMHDLSPLAHGNEALEQGLYDARTTTQTYVQLAALAEHALRGGFPVMADATFLRAEQRQLFRDLAARHGLRLVIADFYADTATLQERITRRAALGTDASDADLAVLDLQMRQHDALTDDESRDVVAFDTRHAQGADIKEFARRLAAAALAP